MLSRILTLLAALALVSGTAGCGVLGPRPMHLTGQFRDSVGLFVGNDVTVLGIKVGTVTGIRPQGTTVLVDLEVDPEVRVPADAGAVTMSPSVVTDRKVELTPVYRGGPTMRDGDLIPLDRTRTPVEIDRVFAAADRLAGQLAALQQGKPVLANALTQAAQTFQGNGDKLRVALQGLSTTVGVGADQRDRLVELIKDVDHLTKAAAANDGTIRSFANNLTDATQLLDEQSPHLVEVLENLTDLLDRTDRLISEHRQKGEATLDNLKVTTDTMAGRTRELAEAADVLPTAFQNLANIVDPTRRTARAHIGLDKALLDNQVPSLLCSQLGIPALCGASDQAAAGAGLVRLLLGGGR
jgi:virulence factor Mce-like protein